MIVFHEVVSALMSKKPPKIEHVASSIRNHAERGDVLFLSHAVIRQGERDVTREEVLMVLIKGRHVPKRDRFDASHHAWSYAVEGRTVEERHLRVIVAFDDGMIVVTVVDLDLEG